MIEIFIQQKVVLRQYSFDSRYDLFLVESIFTNRRKRVDRISRRNRDDDYIRSVQELSNAQEQPQIICIEVYRCEIVRVVVAVAQMVNDLFISHAPVDGLSVIRKDLCQCSSPASASENSKLHE